MASGSSLREAEAGASAASMSCPNVSAFRRTRCSTRASTAASVSNAMIPASSPASISARYCASCARNLASATNMP
eukprot:6175756-Pleurochrysis_carterae.AAC.3